MFVNLIYNIIDIFYHIIDFILRIIIFDVFILWMILSSLFISSISYLMLKGFYLIIFNIFDIDYTIDNNTLFTFITCLILVSNLWYNHSTIIKSTIDIFDL